MSDRNSLPWTKFFWRDWTSDLELQACSLAAQGMWMRMLCVAGLADPVGYVTIGGAQVKDEDIARLCGVGLDEAITLRKELEDRHVFSRNRVGTIYCRRMVRDAAKAQLAVENGKKGGNPTLRKTRQNSASDNSRDNGDTPFVLSDRPNGDVKASTRVPDKAHKPDVTCHLPLPPTPPTSSVAARAGEDQEWIELRKGIVQAYETMQSKVLTPDTHQVDLWRTTGFNPSVCLTVVKIELAKMVAKGDPPTVLKFYNHAIKRAHDDIASGKVAPTQTNGGTAGTPGAKPFVADDEHWRTAMRIFLDGGKLAWIGPGPRPDLQLPGCLVPQRILDEFKTYVPQPRSRPAHA